MADPGSRVGVIIPALNAAGHLSRAIKSVAAQRPSPLDIVVVDGSSTDDSVAVAQSHPGVRIIHQHGRGLGSARNQGLAAVAGEYIGFCDADDCWSADALALRLNALERHPDAIGVIGQILFDSPKGTTPTRLQTTRVGTTRIGFTPGALLARRAAFDRVGAFDENMAIGSDADWFVRLQQSSMRLLFIDEIVLHKSARQGSLSTDVEAYRRELMAIARRFIKDQRKQRRR